MADSTAWLTLYAPFQEPPNHPDGDAKASGCPPHYVIVRHPHYPSHSRMLNLYAPDDPDGGIHHETLRLCCAAIADNRFDGYLTDTRDGPETDTPRHGVLRRREYFFMVPGSSLASPYPVVPSFAHWRFPDELPRIWQALSIQRVTAAPRTSNLTANIMSRDVSCRISGCEEGVQTAHVLPRCEQKWFIDNEMEVYVSHGRQDLNDTANMLLLRSDLHHLFDQRRLVLTPKQQPPEPQHTTPPPPSLVVHVPVESKELFRVYHNLQLKEMNGVAREFLFARFVWSMFPHIKLFLTGSAQRRLSILAKDGKRRTAWFSEDECAAFSMPPPRSRSSSPRPKKKRPASDSDPSDEPSRHKRHKPDPLTPPELEQPSGSSPPEPSTPQLSSLDRLRQEFLQRERARSGVEGSVQADIKWRDEAIGRTLTHEEAIRLYEIWGYEVRRE